ncbi:MAG TPA: PAS domain S-box protein, partial [Actinopolymorphaceae bacterium]
MTGPDDQAPVSAAGLEVFDPSPVGVLVTRGPEHELVYQSPAHRAIFGARALGRPVREAFADVENIGEYVALFDRVFRTGEAATSIDTRISADHPDNSADDERSFTFSVSRFPVGQAAGLLVIITESTDRVQRTEQDRFLDDTRRKVARRYRTLGEIGAQMVMVADPAGSVVEESAGWEAVTGQSFEEYQGFGWLHRVHPDDREQLLEVARDAMERRTPILEHTLRLRTVTGENRYFLLRAVPVFERDQVLEWVGVFTDIETQLIAVRRERLLDKAAAATSGLAQPEEMLTALAEVIVPDIVDSCRVYLVRDDPQRAPGDPFVIDPVASVLAEGLPQVEEHGPEGRGPQTLPGQAILQRRPSLVTFPPGEPPGHIAPRYIRRWVAEARANCMAWLPVIVDGAVAAVAAVFNTGNRPPLSDNDLQLMTDILEHAHDALSSALAFRRTQQIALALQRSFLTDPPDVPGLAVAARYQPTPAGAEVGGDWYDAFTLPDGTLVLSIGDVAGHDLPAA